MRAGNDPKLAAFVEECKRGCGHGSRHGHHGKEGHATGLSVIASADRRTGAGLGRQLRADGLRRRRGHGACRRTTSAISNSRSKYGLPIKQWSIALDQARLRVRNSMTSAWQDWYGEYVALHQFGQVRRSGLRSRGRRHRRRPEREGPGRQAGAVAPARLGHFAASATGAARFRSSTARPAATVPVPDNQLPVRAARGLRARRRGQSAEQARAISSTASARSAASRRGARPTPWTPSWIPPGTTRAMPRRTTTRRWWMSASTTGCRWTSTSAASSTPSCTCCTRASGRKVMRDLGLVNSTSRSPTC